MFMKHVLLLLLGCLLTLDALGQGDWREALRQWMTYEDIEENYGEETLEFLETKASEPINLNQTTREELELLPFLSAQQIEGLVEYLDRYRPMRSLSELMMVTAIDYDTRLLLQHFVYAGEEKPRSVWPQWKDVAHHGKHQLTATGKIPFYERRGDRNGYLGYPYRHDVRYQFDYRGRIKLGLTAAQDAGEPFFASGNNWGYDHYSYYLQLRDMGCLKELNLGMYRVQMGMGLLMNTNLQLGKLASLQSLGRSSHTLTAHSSRSSANYLQGAAATLQVAKRWQVTAFASFRSLDATLNKDGSARTLLTDGYHRTPTEMGKKHNTHRTDLGGSIGWRQGTLYAHANAVYSQLNRPLQPDKTGVLYRRYAAEGNDFFNASLDYGYNNHRWAVSGETAVNRDGAFALLHTLSCKVSDNLSLMALHRYYDKQYTALYARSFSEGGHVQNEHGVYLGGTWHPLRSWTLQGYLDYAHFSWARYQVSAASDAFDALLSTRYQHRRWTLDGRYRYHVRQRDAQDKKLLVNRYEHRLRLGGGYDITGQWSARLQADGVCVRKETEQVYGLMTSLQTSWHGRWLQADGQIGWFHTDDYDSRLYQYERSVRYDFSFPMYYGHGIRYSLLLQADLLKSSLSVAARLGVTRYIDRSTIGTALQQVDHSSMTDLLVQLSYRL